MRYLKDVDNNESVHRNNFLSSDVMNGHNQKKFLWKESMNDLSQKNNFSFAQCPWKIVHVNSLYPFYATTQKL
jgi:hypothetical protein